MKIAGRPNERNVGRNRNGHGVGAGTEVGIGEADVLILPPEVERELSETDESLGTLGRPLDRRNPFFVGLTGGLGIGVAYILFRGLADVTSALVIVGLALFIAVGLNPIIDFLMSRSVSRGLSVGIVTVGFLLAIAAFVVVAVPPIAHEFHVLITNYPRYKANLIAGRGWAGRWTHKLHLTRYLNGKTKLKLPVAGGILGAGRVLLSVGVATVSVVALTIYFLIALPGVKKLWLSLITRSRRERVGLLTDEVFDRVGGFMLGNLLTSVVSALGTYIWLRHFWRSLCSAPGPRRGNLRSHPNGGVDHRRHHCLLGRSLEGTAGRNRHGSLLCRLPLPRGLSPQSTGHEAHRQGHSRSDHHRHFDWRFVLGIIGALIAIPIAATIHLLLQEVAFPRQNRR